MTEPTAVSPIVAALGEGEWWTSQILYNGLVEGLAIGLIAMGIVLVYRSTRVINFAVGNMGLPGSVLLPILVFNLALPFWVAVIASLLVGVLFAAAVELTVVRRLFDAPRVVLLIATVGIATLAQAIVAAYPDIDASGATYPVVSDTVWTDATPFGLRIAASDLSVFVVVPLVAFGLGWLLNRTTFGKTVAASAGNRDLSRLSGVNPRHISTAVWVIAGLVATLSMILLSARRGTLTGVETLGPLTLGKALTAAVLAGMRSFPRAMVAGIGVGIGTSIVGFRFFEEPGLADFLMFLAVLVAIWFQSRTERSDDVVSFVPKVRPVPERLRHIWWVRNLARLILGGMLGALLLVVMLEAVGVAVIPPSRYLVWSVIAAFSICAASVMVITGWAGQLSLAQMAFAGIGALTAAALHRGAEIDLGSGAAILTLPAMPFVVSILVASLVTAGLAALIGIGALRVRGLLLAVSTFMFALACQAFLFRQPLFSADFGPSVPFERGNLFGLELGVQRTWFLVTLGALVIVVVVLGHLRRSGLGRRTIAVRDNPDAAAAYAISVVRTKLAAFALAGGIAGFGGAMLSAAVESVPWGQRLFLVGDSLRVVAMAVIGGLSSVIGPVIGALWVEGLPSLFPESALLPLLASSIGLLVLLLYCPGGLVQLAFQARDALFERLARRLPPAAVGAVPRAPVSSAIGVRSTRTASLPDTVLRTEDLVVSFGGIRAVDHVSIDVGRDEIVGLIGTNGAGKSSLMNAIGGFVRSQGEVELLGRSVTNASAARRARLGLGRTFQGATLFPELTVLETVQVALEARHRSALESVFPFLPAARRAERRSRSDADELIAFLGLGPYADHYVSELSTGTRRIVELAGLLAIDAPVLCLDEPTAGLAQREGEAFGPLLTEIRAELGASMLIIEHDMPIIMSMSDRVYCLDAGRLIAHGTPDDVRNDPHVIASYLGTDERALARSGSVPPAAPALR